MSIDRQAQIHHPDLSRVAERLLDNRGSNDPNILICQRRNHVSTRRSLVAAHVERRNCTRRLPRENVQSLPQMW